jgi:ketosteroid isomerase-like protein
MSGAADWSADHAAIATTSAKLLAAVNACDVAGILAVWADDGVLMPPHHPSVHGLESLRTYFADLFSRTRFAFEFTSSSIELVGDTAFEFVTYAVSMRSSDGRTAGEDRGKGLHVYRHQEDGSWQLIRDIWNSDQPATTAPPLRDQHLN